MASLWAALALGKDVENPSAFVHRAAFRIVRRKNKKYKMVPIDEMPDELLTSSLESYDLFIELNSALSNLDLKTREVAVFAASCLKTAEIARASGLSRSTIARRLERLRSFLFRRRP